jgi:hypothetical protein
MRHEREWLTSLGWLLGALAVGMVGGVVAVIIGRG